MEHYNKHPCGCITEGEGSTVRFVYYCGEPEHHRSWIAAQHEPLTKQPKWYFSALERIFGDGKGQDSDVKDIVKLFWILGILVAIALLIRYT